MAAVGIALAAFACWSVVGYAVVSSLLPHRQAISNLLLAPVVGMGVLELAAHAGLRCGSPVGPLSIGIVLGALVVAVAVLFIRRPPVPIRRMAPFYLILLVALTLSGWPLFRWGGDWIANANHDMAQYCLGATGFREHGFRELEIDKYFAGNDSTYLMWWMYCDRTGVRHGCEMSLAMTSALTGQAVPFIFMPVILAMHLALISSVGFLLYRLSAGRTAFLITCTLMAISPLSTYSIVQQLLGQVGGLGLLVAGTGLFLRPASKLPALGVLKRGILGGIVAASLMLHYTEAVPFLVLGFGLHVTIGFVRRRFDLKQAGVAILSAALLFPLLGDYLIQNVGFLLVQASSKRNIRPDLIELFPQYLEAGGFARLWGFETIYEPVKVHADSPWPVHRLVLGGLFFLLLSLTAGIALAWRRRPVGAILLVMAGVAAFLARGKAAFGLFKLALYAQPFILGAIVLGWARMKPGYMKWAGLVAIVSLVPLQLITQRHYVSYSAKPSVSGGEVPGATDEHLLRQYQDAIRTPGARRFLAPVNNKISMKLLGCVGRGVTLYVPAMDLDLLIHPLDVPEPFRTRWITETPSEFTASEGRRWFSMPSNGPHLIALHDPANAVLSTEFKQESPAWVDRPEEGDYLLDPPVRFSPFNRFGRSSRTNGCRAVPLGEVTNYILWRPSSLSRAFDGVQGANCGLYSLQPDPYFPRETMAAAGQFLSCQVLNPSTKTRVMLTGTAIFLPGGKELPNAFVVGDKRVSLPFSGEGAARLISEPISAQSVGTSHFILLDLGRSPSQTIQHDDNHARDPREISLYLRDVSLLTEEEYTAIVPPKNLQSFPADLANNQLEFSGCAEDGSVGDRAWFRLMRPDKSGPLIVRGKLLQSENNTKSATILRVKWNGAEVAQRAIGSSEFELSTALPEGHGPGKLELELAGNQSHTARAHLTFVGFELDRSK